MKWDILNVIHKKFKIEISNKMSVEQFERLVSTFNTKYRDHSSAGRMLKMVTIKPEKNNSTTLLKGKIK